jgi:hypothetical protein
LFAQGILKGDYRSNEKKEITGWYSGSSPSQAERPMYYLIADNPTEKADKQDYPRGLLASAYSEAGAILVFGQPRIHIFRRANASGATVGQHEEAALAPLFDRIRGVNQRAGEQP